MNKKLTIEELNKILDSYIGIQKVMNKASDAGCIDVDGPFYNTIWKAFDDMVSILDPYSWIFWYIYDNDMGNASLEAVIDDKKIKIENRRDLLEVMNS